VDSQEGELNLTLTRELEVASITRETESGRGFSLSSLVVSVFRRTSSQYRPVPTATRQIHRHRTRIQSFCSFFGSLGSALSLDFQRYQGVSKGAGEFHGSGFVFLRLAAWFFLLN
jgi:hypothetical protein